MILNTVEITPDIYQKGLEMAERVFETEQHPDQMEVSQASFEKLKSIHPDTILYEVRENSPVAWIVALPTTKELMQRFLSKEINEQNLLDDTPKLEKYDALYLCATATLPEHRRQGIARRLVETALARLPLQEGYEIFAWPTTELGKIGLKKMEEETGRVIPIRQ